MKTTPLHNSHIALNAKMGAFAGYDMPLYYADGVMKEHEWTRSRAGIFDVSHMGQITLEGPGAAMLLERLTPSSFAKQKINTAKYTVLTNSNGGIIDDLMVTRCGEESYFCVINAGCKEKDISWIEENLPSDVDLKRHDDHALIALQGPEAEKVIKEKLGFDLSALAYMAMQVFGDIYISRMGYTGEDGFEISLPAARVAEVWNKLLSHSSVKPVGLAARDSLRLEMGYCLYGHDIDDSTTPVEADLGWVMGKANTGFIGADIILPQKEKGAARRRVGVRLLDKGVAREGTVLCDADGKTIGSLTSGSFSPTLKESIGQGYVDIAFVAQGTKIFADVRGRKIHAEVAVLPFIKPRTKTVAKSS